MQSIKLANAFISILKTIDLSNSQINSNNDEHRGVNNVIVNPNKTPITNTIKCFLVVCFAKTTRKK